MKITFIDPTQSIINYGLRTISQYLVQRKYDIQIIFLNQSIINYDYDYPQSIYNDLKSLISGSDIVGLSFVSNYLGQAIKLTKFLKKHFDVPVIWGGIHAIASPEESLEYADLVCVGEGEICMLKLLEEIQTGRNYQNVPNLWFKENNEIFRNETASIDPEIDSYSLPFYNDAKEFIRNGDNIRPLNDELRQQKTVVPGNYYDLGDKPVYPYLTLASRGCPNACAYCCNNLFRKIYKGKGKLVRRRSNANIIEELETALTKMPFVNFIEFFDDDFIHTDTQIIAEFADMYKKRINLPFRCNFRPSSVTNEKISLLNEAGLTSIEMGLQSASPKTNKLYRRHFDREQFLGAANIISNFKNIKAHYDIIVDNPFEKYEDIKKTLQFLMELPRPYELAVFSLTFFPGTELYELAKSRGLISDEIADIINRRNNIQYEFKNPYINFLLLFIRKVKFNTKFSRFLFKLLSSRTSLYIFDSIIFYPFWALILFLKRAFSKIRHNEVSLIPQ